MMDWELPQKLTNPEVPADVGRREPRISEEEIERRLSQGGGRSLGEILNDLASSE